MVISARQSKEGRKIEIDSSVEVMAVLLQCSREVSLSIESATPQGNVSSGQKGSSLGNQDLYTTWTAQSLEDRKHKIPSV